MTGKTKDKEVKKYMEMQVGSSYGRIFSKLIRGYSFRYHQSEFVGKKVAESPYPSIICGDFNDIPNSSTYFNVKGQFAGSVFKKRILDGKNNENEFWNHFSNLTY